MGEFENKAETEDAIDDHSHYHSPTTAPFP